MNSYKITPIFVMGVPRSGTTGLANMLCQHSEIACIQSKRHYGIHESHFFNLILNRYGDISEDSNFIEFIEAFSASDYFILSGIEKKYIYLKRPKTYPEFFKLLMDEFAHRNNARFWLEKTPAHSLYIEDIAKYYPSAKFIIIKRDLEEAIKSDIKMHYDFKTGRFADDLRIPYPFILLYLVFRYNIYYKSIYKFCRKNMDRCYITTFENFIKDRKKVIIDLCSFLNIKFEKNMMVDKYPPNSSFKYNQEREKVLTSHDYTLIRIFDFFIKMMPYLFYRPFLLIYKSKIRRPSLPPWFYSIKKENLLK